MISLDLVPIDKLRSLAKGERRRLFNRTARYLAPVIKVSAVLLGLRLPGLGLRQAALAVGFPGIRLGPGALRPLGAAGAEGTEIPDWASR